MSDQTVSRRVRQLLLGPLLTEGFELVDVEHHPGLLRVIVDRPEGIDLDALDGASRVASAVLDDADPLPSSYTLEVSSPGVERRLRTPEHFVRFVGSTVSLRTRDEGEPRVRGVLESADDTGVVVAGRSLPYDRIRSARTVFVWPAAPAPRARPPKPRKAVAGR